MTIKHLRELLAAIPADQQHFEVEVWLPGSYISLGGSLFQNGKNRFLIEGDLKPGSALEQDQ